MRFVLLSNPFVFPLYHFGHLCAVHCFQVFRLLFHYFPTHLPFPQKDFPESSLLIPVVHGGLGLVSRSDVVHACVEQQRALPEEELAKTTGRTGRFNRRRAAIVDCDIYALGSGIRPEAAKEAVKSKIVIKRCGFSPSMLQKYRT